MNEQLERAREAVELIDMQALATGLYEIGWAQASISALVPDAISNPPTNDQIAIASFALVDEVMELANELGWKRWKDNQEPTDEWRDAIAEEYADVLAFLGQLTCLLFLRSGVTAKDLAEAYVQKSRKNVARFTGESDEEGYNGVVQ